MKKFDYRNTTDYSELQKYLDVRKDNNSADVEGIVKDIIDKVRAEGDDALRFYNAKFDGCTIQDLKVSEEEIEEAFRNIDKDLLGSIEKAAAGHLPARLFILCSVTPGAARLPSVPRCTA